MTKSVCEAELPAAAETTVTRRACAPFTICAYLAASWTLEFNTIQGNLNTTRTAEHLTQFKEI